MIEFVDRFESIVRRPVAGLRDGIINVFLGGRQNLHMLDRFDVHCRNEMRRQLAFVLDDKLGSFLYGFLVGLINLQTKGFCGQTMNVRTRAKRILSNVRPGKIRLDARRSFCHERDRARRSDGRHFVISRRELHVFWNSDVFVKEFGIRVPVRLELRKRAFLFAKPQRFHPGFAPNEAHYPFDQFERFVAAICDAKLQAKICKTHNTQADRPRAFHDIVDLSKREVSCIDDIVEEPCAQMNGPRQTIPFDFFAIEEFRDVDRTKIARIVEMQLLLTARIAREYRAHRRHHVVMPIHFVDEDNARLCIFMRGGYDPIPNI